MQGETYCTRAVDQQHFTVRDVPKLFKDKMKISSQYVSQDQIETPESILINSQCSNTNGETQALPGQSWWMCPWCDFKINQEPRSRAEGVTTSRIRSGHLKNQHPQEDQTAKQRSQKGEPERMQKILASRKGKTKQIVDSYQGQHELTAICYSVKCKECGWKGAPDKLPNTCNLMHRGGLRLNADTMKQ